MNEPNMLKAIEPKSDQLNADDLIGGRTLTIKITKVSGLEGEQKIAINYEGDNGKPYKPGKSMCRVLVSIWGSKGSDYVGRSMTLYRDDTVMFGPIQTGGIRISHMSNMTEPLVIALTNKKGSRKPFTVKPLVVQEPQGLTAHEVAQLKTAGQTAANGGTDALKVWWKGLGGTKQKTLGEPFLEELKALAAKYGQEQANSPNDA